MDRAKKLKYIIRAGSGLDNIDVTVANKKNIRVFNLPNLNAVSVAEFALGLIISSVSYTHLTLPTSDLV